MGCTSKNAGSKTTLGEMRALKHGGCHGSSSIQEGFLQCPPNLPGEKEQLGEDVVTSIAFGASKHRKGGKCTVVEDPVKLVKNMVCASVGAYEGCCVQKVLTPDNLSTAEKEQHRVALKLW